MKTMRTKITVGDIIITAATLAVAVFLLVSVGLLNRDARYAAITVRNRGTERYILHENREIMIESDGITLCVIIEDGGGYIRESDCRDQVCVMTGRIDKSGQSIICAPAGVAVTIVGGGGDDDEADHIAG